MTERIFQVWNNQDRTRFVVTDKFTADENRPAAALFTVSVLYDENLQSKRAHEYANYLNKLNEAAKVAYEQIH